MELKNKTATVTGLASVRGIGERTNQNQVTCPAESPGVSAHFWTRMACVLLIAMSLCGCEDLVPHDTSSLLAPKFQRSEIVGLIAGFGTTFAALPDLVTMLRRRSSKGMNPTMSGIMGIFQIAWIYYGLLILSRPVVVWNTIAVLINSLSVAAYVRFARSERKQG